MQVQEPNQPGPTVIVADCPTIAYLPQLLQCLPASLFSAPTAEAEASASPAATTAAAEAGALPAADLVNCIIHLSPAQVSYLVSSGPFLLSSSTALRALEQKAVHLQYRAS